MKYDYGFTTFFDILGFKELIKNNDMHEMKKIVDAFYDTSKRIQTPENDNKTYKVSSVYFSDSVVRAGILPEETDEDNFCEAFLSELCDISCIQLELLKIGVLIRGGISYGQIYLDCEDSVVFGPSLVESYKLESELAIFPRIIVSPQIIDTLEEYIETEHKNTVFNIMKCLTLDKDGLFFVDYMKQSMSMQYYLDEHKRNKVERNVFYDDMMAHKKIICENSCKKNNLGVQQKYSWLTSYHNDILFHCPDDILSESQNTDVFLTDDDNPCYRTYMSMCYEFDNSK